VVRLVREGEEEIAKWAHPDPYTVSAARKRRGGGGGGGGSPRFVRSIPHPPHLVVRVDVAAVAGGVHARR